MASRAGLLERMESLLDGCGNIGEFIDDTQRIEEYFPLIEAYYGGPERFFRDTFDIQLAQIREVLSRIPELAGRLWTKVDRTTWNFSLTCNRALARDFHPSAWLDYLNDWENGLKREVGTDFPLDDRRAFNESSRAVLTELAREVSEFQHGLAERKLSRKKLRAALPPFFREIQKRPKLAGIAAGAVWHALRHLPTRSQLLCENGDLILEQMRVWRGEPLELLPPDLKDLASPIASMIRKRIPKLEELKARKDIFPPKLRKTRANELTESIAIKAGRYDFETPSRGFHSVFRGIAAYECLSGARGNERTHPARWVSCLIEGAEAIHITGNEHYHGSIQVIPVQNGNDRWGLLEFWSPLLASQAIVEGPEGVRSGLFAHEVIRALVKRCPPEWKGLCYCNHPELDHWGVAWHILGPAFALFSEKIGSASDFVVKDELAWKVAEALPRGHRSGKYPPGPIHAGRFKPANDVPMIGFRFTSA